MNARNRRIVSAAAPIVALGLFWTDRELFGLPLLVVSMVAASCSECTFTSSSRIRTWWPTWHPHPDGERFLIALIGDTEAAAERSIRAIFNWSLLRR